jgi:hypothetical protein
MGCGAGAGVDGAVAPQKKLEVRKMLENAAESHYAANNRYAVYRMIVASSSQIILSRVLSRMGLLNVMLKPRIPMTPKSNTAQSAYGTER